MKVIDTTIPDVKILEPTVFGDSRGFFLESYNQTVLSELGFDWQFVQDNHSRSSKGILRGLHYQTQKTQGKLVRVTQGSVFDVAVDIRQSSPTYGKWVGEILSDENHHMLWVPPGFAHGFLVISDSADFLYKCTDFYAPEYEHSIRWDCPEINIEWPLQDGQLPSISDKDAAGSILSKAPKMP